MPVAARDFVGPGSVRGQWWHPLEDGRIQCDLCPRRCKLHEGQRGFCYVRQARDGGVVLASYGRASGFCIDPIEKKPLHHFYPGTSVLSFGTAMRLGRGAWMRMAPARPAGSGFPDILTPSPAIGGRGASRSSWRRPRAGARFEGFP